MRTLVLATALAGGLAFGVQAETFTLTSTGSGIAQVTTPGPNGTIRFAGVAAIKGTTTMAGKTLAHSGQCASWPSLAGDIFQSHGMCAISDASGAFYVRYGCNPAKEPMSDNCVGGIWGTGGAYAGRSGTAAWHSRGAPDGKSSISEGAGQWGD